MPVRKSIKDKLSDTVAPPNPQQSAENVDETSKKVSRLATATSVCAFIATACLVFSFVTHAQASSTVAEVQADLVQAVIAVEDIPKGAVVKEGMVSVASIPSKYLGSDSVTSIDEVLGKQAIVLISKNSQLQTGELSGKANNSSLSGRIAKGKKAVSIDVTSESDFACSLLHQGDRVSLYCFKGSEKSKQELAKDVEVIALDGSLSYEELTGSGTSASYSNVTVEVDQTTAIEIRGAQDSDKTIWFVLSSEADRKK